jgi:hypothetical protein
LNIEAKQPEKLVGAWRRVVGWTAVTLSTAITSFWAFWGIIENFHEGWYQPSLAMRLAMMFGQYLSPMLAFLIASLLSIRWPRMGAAIHLAAAAFAIWFFTGGAAHTLIVPPMLFLCFGYWFGRAEPRKWAYGVVLAAPAVTLLVCGVPQAIRVALRVDDGMRTERHLTANGVDLLWAPAGPGWPQHGMNWHDAMHQCQHLSADGTTLADTPQNIWRLPTVEEAVRSQCLHGENCGGEWDTTTGQPRYHRQPDKESPLWDPTSKVIYWWTATEVNDKQAYMIAYNGQVHPRRKDGSFGYHAFRAVKSPRTIHASE